MCVATETHCTIWSNAEVSVVRSVNPEARDLDALILPATKTDTKVQRERFTCVRGSGQ
jgi:hypothetical protein